MPLECLTGSYGTAMSVPSPDHVDGDGAAALQRSGDDPVLASFVQWCASVREPGETIREIALTHPSTGPAAVAVTSRRVLVDARSTDGSVHALPTQAITQVRLEPTGGGGVDLVLQSIGARISLVGLSAKGARRLQWALQLDDLVESFPHADTAARFNAWLDVVGDAGIDDDERAEEIDRILSM